MLTLRSILLFIVSFALLTSAQTASAPVDNVIAVAGEVIRPGRFAFRDNMHVTDAIAIAGGFRDRADQEHIAVVRGRRRYIFNYQEFLAGKNLEDNFLLQVGDVVFVP